MQNFIATLAQQAASVPAAAGDAAGKPPVSLSRF